MTTSVVKNGLVMVVILLFVGVALSPVATAVDIDTNDDISDDSIGLGFIFCWTWVFYSITPYQGFGIPAPFVLVSCTDLDTGEVRYGITFLSFCFFKFLKRGHDYKISAEVSGFDEVIIKNLQFFDIAVLMHEGLP